MAFNSDLDLSTDCRGDMRIQRMDMPTKVAPDAYAYGDDSLSGMRSWVVGDSRVQAACLFIFIILVHACRTLREHQPDASEKLPAQSTT